MILRIYSILPMNFQTRRGANWGLHNIYSSSIFCLKDAFNIKEIIKIGRHFKNYFYR